LKQKKDERLFVSSVF